MKVKKIVISQFKGIANAEYTFDEITRILGQNGVGKTSIVDALYWLFCNKDYELNENPNIRPNNMDESLPRVEAFLDINGVETQFAKQQKCKTTGNKISLTNSYEINCVPKAEKDVKEYFLDKGIDFDKLLLMSHPEIFTKDINDKKVRDDRRNILFSMVEDVSDYDVAKQTDGCSDIVNMLADYSVEEITVMQNATLSKIKETYGKDGELIDNRIIGLESAKNNDDVAEYELEKKAIKDKIAQLESILNEMDKAYEINREASKNVLDLKFKLSEIERKAIESDATANLERTKKINAIQNEIQSIDTKYLQNMLTSLNIDKNKLNDNKEYLKNKYISTKKMVFDESTCTCKYCGQEYPEEKKAELKMSFEATKNKDLQSIADDGNKINEKLKDIAEKIADNEKKIADNTTKLAELTKQLSEVESTPIIKTDYQNSDEYKALSKEIEEKEKALKDMQKSDDIEIKFELAKQNDLLNQIERKIGSFENNIKIDEQISALEQKKLDMAQNKADCEKILYQLKLLSQKKNEMLSDAVNKNFDLVKFQLFEYQKNGEIKDTCKATIDGKDFSECNGALKTLAKIDICNGLQKFFKADYPIIIDEYEHITSNTNSRIKTDSQLITLSCTEDKELIVKGE